MDVEIHLLIGSVLVLILSAILAIARSADTLPQLLPSYNAEQKSFKKDRRAHPRYKALLKMRYETPAEQGMSWISDVSRGGLRLFLNADNFEIGSLFQAEIELPADPKPIFARGNIVWAKNEEAGLSFREVNQDDINRIFEYIDNRSQLISSKNT